MTAPMTQESHGTGQSRITERIFAEYSEQETPLVSYAVFVAAYHLAFVAFLRLLRTQGKRLPDHLSIGDMLLLGIATHKLSRIIAKDWVTSPFRAPFTTYQGSIGSGEINEKARGQGMRRAFGELITCPWCMGPWVAAGLTYGMVLAPRPTRLITTIFTAVTASDFLHHIYGAARQLQP